MRFEGAGATRSQPVGAGHHAVEVETSRLSIGAVWLLVSMVRIEPEFVLVVNRSLYRYLLYFRFCRISVLSALLRYSGLTSR